VARSTSPRTGTVYLVGAGPGDPELMTVKAQRLLRQADVVVYDHLVSPRILRACRASAELVNAGKRPRHHTMRQDAINRLLVRRAKAGRSVVRLKGGDPFVFGRGGEEAQVLAQHRIPFEIVPGVTSAIGVPAYAGIPVTHRAAASSVTILTGHEDPARPEGRIRWEHLAAGSDTLVCLMGVASLPGIVEQLLRHGRRPSEPCAVIEWGTYPSQRTVAGTLRTIAAQAESAQVHPPAVFITGEVVRLRAELNWFERRPLLGSRILVTRAAEKAQELAGALRAMGASVDTLPAIELAPVHANGGFREAIDSVAPADWVFFTSPEGIGWFSKLLRSHRKRLDRLDGCRIGAIGPKTAVALEAAGLEVDYIPRRFSQEGLVNDLPQRIGKGRRAFIFSAEAARDVLEDGLRRRGLRVTRVPIYRTVMPPMLARDMARLADVPFDFVTATSASCVDHLAQALAAARRQRRFSSLPFASIGPVTSAAIRERGGRVAVEAAESTIEGLVHAMIRRAPAPRAATGGRAR
jgi:uroporphyrinogen III methyltransferase/synthase